MTALAVFLVGGVIIYQLRTVIQWLRAIHETLKQQTTNSKP